MKNLLVFVIFCLSSLQAKDHSTFHYYSTVSDEKHYPLLLNLIGSIHNTDYDCLDEIAVFDIGLTKDQKNTLNRMAKVKVFDVEKRHPDLLTPFQTANNGKMVRGWYAWKPVLMKQSLDMYPYFLFLDAGSLVLNSPSPLFRHIEQNGYFFITVSHNIVDRLTHPVRDYFVSKLSPEQQAVVIDPLTQMVAGGVQGISRFLYFDYIFPLFLAAGNLDFFKDDGSSRLGFGAGRHDQTLMSIIVRSKGYKTMNAEGWSDLRVDGKTFPFHYHWDSSQVLPQTMIYSCRWDFSHSQHMQAHIHWK